MKKMIFFSLLFLFMISPVMAEQFVVDVNKIDINYKSNELIDGLDKEFKIDTKDFKRDRTEDKKAKEYVKKILDILFGEYDERIRRRDFLYQGYITDNDGFNVLTSSYNLQAFYDEVIPKNIKYDYIKYINVTTYSEGLVATVYVPKATVNVETMDIIFTFVLREVDGEYRVFLASYVTGDDLANKYYEIEQQETSGNVIAGGSKNLSLTGNTEMISDEELINLFNNNKEKVVSISALTNGVVNSYGNGFYIRDGVIVTTWSLFLKILNNNDFIYVNDAVGNVYTVQGVIAADTNYDIVLLKLSDNYGKGVTFSNSEDLNVDDRVFMISSKSNTGYSISYGSFVSLNSGVLKNQLVVSQSDIGSPLFNKEGNVIGFNTGNIINSSISNANSTDYLIEVQKRLIAKDFDKIDCTSVKEFKDKYYYSYTEEKRIDNVSKKVWDEYKKQGDLENTIQLDILKKSYKDGILSIRYKNSVYGSLDTLLMTAAFEDSLLKDNYKLIYETSTKRIYESEKYRVVIKESLDYLIIIMMEK